MKSEPHTSSPEFTAFDRVMAKILCVSHEEIQRRIKAHKEESARNPRKRGPKPKASGGAGRAG
jgi:hypothetical protein